DAVYECAALAGFEDIHVVPLNVFGDYLPWKRSTLEKWLRFEQRIPWLARWGYYLILTGRKP
ncbi:unnamed protein product, partial [marine sediment metagenome]